MESKNYEKLIKVINDLGVTTEELSTSLNLLSDAMLRNMAIEMIQHGCCTLSNGKILHLEDAGERFLEIYKEELANKRDVL